MLLTVCFSLAKNIEISVEWKSCRANVVVHKNVSISHHTSCFCVSSHSGEAQRTSPETGPENAQPS